MGATDYLMCPAATGSYPPKRHTRVPKWPSDADKHGFYTKNEADCLIFCVKLSAQEYRARNCAGNFDGWRFGGRVLTNHHHFKIFRVDFYFTTPSNFIFKQGLGDRVFYFILHHPTHFTGAKLGFIRKAHDFFFQGLGNN